MTVSTVLPEALGNQNRRALILGWAYYLNAFSSYLLRTWLPSLYHGQHNWYTRGALNALRLTLDMDRTVSRCSKPNSCTAFIGKQPNPWNILQTQVAKSRHPMRALEEDQPLIPRVTFIC
ncbi:Metallocarboxypeptidase inhibitor [Cucumis melo var. makuwa]|uniref:Metallocarboxypeptidase inhibitor n=1 Tax=Cucumis melo var. makuwa TaxID=1194695 RepID=A0A5D3BWZ1_CUCMM|nr:Metallocarboxypeptidase inhibitor [Cucumis melo var. makuwa]TYK03594.1 Metallocarboxypeptidase inhibitor [Cucumis melo var. makuwa]